LARFRQELAKWPWYTPGYPNRIEGELHERKTAMPQPRAPFVLFDGFDPLDVGGLQCTPVNGERTGA
jgi:hypothetical protein